MQHVVYAIFDSTEDAEAAVKQIEAQGDAQHRCTVTLHRRPLRMEELSGAETAGRQGLIDGALLGTGLGAIVGAAGAVVLGLPLLGGLVVGSIGGAAYAGLFGAIGGASAPDANLEKLDRKLKEGGVLLTVTSPGMRCEEDVENILRHAAREVAHHRAM